MKNDELKKKIEEIILATAHEELEIREDYTNPVIASKLKVDFVELTNKLTELYTETVEGDKYKKLCHEMNDEIVILRKSSEELLEVLQEKIDWSSRQMPHDSLYYDGYKQGLQEVMYFLKSKQLSNSGEDKE